MSHKEDDKKLDRTADYLLSEFQVLHERARMFETTKAKRVNFFLLVVAAFGAVVSGLAQTSPFKENILALIQVLSLSVFLLGVFVLRDLTAYSSGIIFQYRWAGRIRRWFLEENKSLKPFLPFKAVDDRPTFTESFLYWRGSETIVLLLNSYLIALIIGTSVFSYLTQQIELSLLIGSVSAAAYWYLQKLYNKRQMLKIENSDYVQNTIFFPSSKYP
jgi:hypothetical protein